MIFVALTFLLVAVLGSAAVATVRGIRLWRTLNGTSERAGDAFEQLPAAGAATEERAMSLQGNSARLAAAIARLQEALAAFAVIRAAAREPHALLRSARASVPRK